MEINRWLEEDRVVWKPNPIGEFTKKLAYDALKRKKPMVNGIGWYGANGLFQNMCFMHGKMLKILTNTIHTSATYSPSIVSMLSVSTS